MDEASLEAIQAMQAQDLKDAEEEARAEQEEQKRQAGDEEWSPGGEQEEAPEPPAPSKPPKKKAKRKRVSAPRGVLLLDLINDGCISPGPGVLKVVYKDEHYVADLTEDGIIRFEGEEWESPSSWSIFVKRKTNPGKKADDGWKSVFYQETRIENIKHEYLKKMYGLGGGLPFGQTQIGSEVGKAEVLRGVSSKPPRIDRGPPYANGAGPNGSQQTDYAKQRPKREVRSRQWQTGGLGVDQDGHSMVPMEYFYGSPGSGEAGSQPFRVEVSSNCEIVMDIHSYMSEKHEIIGLLGGHFDANARPVSLRVVEAFPVREISTEDNTINVEMDPESEVQVREEMKKKGLVCVGWYHSHPSFPAIPSVIDLKNQLNYQTLVRDDKAGLEPFVAGIVSPYNPKISDFKSELSWFYVAHKNTDRGSRGAEPAGFAPGACELDKDCRSMSLDVQPSLDSTQLIVNVMAKIKTLAKWYSNSANSTEWSSLWDGNVTLMDKMMSSVSQRLPRSWQGTISEVFLGAVRTSLNALWEKNNVQAQLQMLEEEEYE